MSESTLPPGFAELERFTEKWSLPDTQGRIAVRYTSSMDELNEFYDAVLSRADDAFAALEGHSLQQLEGDWLRLYRLLMSLAHVAHAAERHGRPNAANTTYPTSLTILRGMSPA